MKPKVRKIDFFKVFEAGVRKERISIGESEEVLVTIDCAEFGSLDLQVFQTIWLDGIKYKTADSVVSVISAGTLFSTIKTEINKLNNVFKRLSRIAIEVTCRHEKDTQITRYNLVDLVLTYDAGEQFSAVTMEIRFLAVLDWLFCDDFVDLLYVNCA